MKKHKIMITNDDGIQSVGLRAAVMAAKEFGDVIVVAPVTQQTAMEGHTQEQKMRESSKR